MSGMWPSDATTERMITKMPRPRAAGEDLEVSISQKASNDFNFFSR